MKPEEEFAPLGRLRKATDHKDSKTNQTYELTQYIRKTPTKIKKEFLDVYLSNRMILHKGNRVTIVLLEGDQEHRKGMKKMFKQLNQPTKDLASATGNI